jgi:ubiquinone/menaquinone biosynthesis C-methylase UbiE
VNVREERDFERDNVARKRQRYLRTNPLERMATDHGYRVKVERMRAGLTLGTGPVRGLILDIGGNTAGEATILQQEGFQFVVSDINEMALEISQERVTRFELQPPAYVACDVHSLAFAGESFSAVTVIEALHHFPDYGKALGEIHRVLQPGGMFYAYEPNALSPLRRLSEVRDRLRGTVEKSFYQGQATRLCRAAGFDTVEVRAVPGGRSSWKLDEVPLYRRPVARLHGWLQQKLPAIFGPLIITARKAGRLQDEPARPESWKSRLRSPTGGLPLVFDPDQKRWCEVNGPCCFPDRNGIPVLVKEDAMSVSGSKPVPRA